MRRTIATALLALALKACGQAAPAQPPQSVQSAQSQCWLEHLSGTERRELVLGYARMQEREGKAMADAWAQGVRSGYEERFAAEGVCPSADGGASSDPIPSRGSTPLPKREASQAPEAGAAPQLLNRYGKPCKRIELENQNVPNVGGSMGWALVQVCKD